MMASTNGGHTAPRQVMPHAFDQHGLAPGDRGGGGAATADVDQRVLFSVDDQPGAVAHAALVELEAG